MADATATVSSSGVSMTINKKRTRESDAMAARVKQGPVKSKKTRQPRENKTPKKDPQEKHKRKRKKKKDKKVMGSLVVRMGGCPPLRCLLNLHCCVIDGSVLFTSALCGLGKELVGVGADVL